MTRHPVLSTALIAIVFASGYVAGQRQPPSANVGQSEEQLRTQSLTGEIDSGDGRVLRMRKLSLEPGGVLGLHTHADRPAVTYLLQGELTYRADGKPDVVIKAGGGTAEGRATTHWAENTGKGAAVWLGIDIVKP